MWGRRQFLKVVGGLMGVGAWSTEILAAFQTAWREAFALKGQSAVLEALGIVEPVIENPEGIEFIAPEIAENGAVVPIEVTSHLPETVRILILVQKNPNTLAADNQFYEHMHPHVALRLKLAETTEVRALVKSASGWSAVGKLVKVTLGGCGG